MPLATYIARRAVYTVILVFFVLTLNFAIFAAMPGDPISILASALRLRPEQVETLVELYGLDQPILTRYLKYMYSMLTFQFGFSYYYGGRPVIELIAERLPNTLLLLGLSTMLAIIMGTLIGATAAYRRGGRFDSTVVTASLVTYSLPTFWMGMIFLLIFGYCLRMFPLGGTMSRPPPVELWARIVDIGWHLFLPALTIFLFLYGGFALLARSSVLETLTEDYILTAKAKGLPDRSILFRHALRNALLPLTTQYALALSGIIAGAIITETIFTWDGMGRLMWIAVTRADYPVLQACFYIFALATILANFAADIIYGLIDPRVRYE